MSKHISPEHHDSDNPEWTDADIGKAVPFSGLPGSLQAKLRGRPKAEAPKEHITIRLSPDVLAAFRATGAGWQTRIDEALRAWLSSHVR